MSQNGIFNVMRRLAFCLFVFRSARIFFLPFRHVFFSLCSISTYNKSPLLVCSAESHSPKQKNNTHKKNNLIYLFSKYISYSVRIVCSRTKAASAESSKAMEAVNNGNSSNILSEKPGICQLFKYKTIFKSKVAPAKETRTAKQKFHGFFFMVFTIITEVFRLTRCNIFCAPFFLISVCMFVFDPMKFVIISLHSIWISHGIDNIFSTYISCSPHNSLCFPFPSPFSCASS